MKQQYTDDHKLADRYPPTPPPHANYISSTTQFSWGGAGGVFKTSTFGTWSAVIPPALSMFF